ncbi:hypothetical protein [Geodermatophilus poikilotrophus]|uniref:SipW-cognate class signal peptide n=1 Tax=Geodermatophilus poikilotrophus TaxID=1333667 RepID=A0A1I0EM56_9ACTN|nr:hypothetical protein [Geodermatophilus poikilotrophus]SET46471.1 hypothetical protein SAMN04488546_2468 [Geodermatophilus poikilotrophus]
MRYRAPRARRTALSVAVPVGLVTSLALTWGATHAAFSATTHNPGNSWETGTVDLDNNAKVGAVFTPLFSAEDGLLKPGSTGSRCIRIDYTGSLEAEIRMYIEPDGTGSPAGAEDLDPYLVMSIERGVDVDPETEVAVDCSGFTPRATATFLDRTHPGVPDATSRTLAHLRTEHRDFGSGIVVEPAATENTSMTLRITYVLADNDDAQGKLSEATFTWEARNTGEAGGTP